MRKNLSVMLRWTLLMVLCLSIPSVIAGPIQQQSGQNQWDYVNDRWINVCNALSSADGVIITGGAGSGWTDGECGMEESQSFLSIFNPASGANTWDRVRVASGDALAATGILAAGNVAFNGTTWDRVRASIGNTDAVVAGGISGHGMMLFNGTTWDRVRSSADSDPSGTGKLGVILTGVNNAATPAAGAFNVLRTAGAGPLALTVGGGGVLAVAPYSTWSVTNTPAAATQATASRAAGAAGVRHVATTVTVCLAAGGTAQTPILAHLRDGATGAGTILRSWAFSAPVNTSKCDNIDGLAMLGTAATAMTVEFTGAGVASSQQTVTLTGFSTQ